MGKSWQGVSRTAHFTAAVWHELGVVGSERFVTRQGRFLNRVVHWGGATVGLYGHFDVVKLFLAPRYLGIDALLAQRQPRQVIELAAGLSPRGSEWVRLHGGTYLEIDQVAVVSVKQALLPAEFFNKANFRLISGDVFKEDLRASILAVADPLVPTVLICEGLTGYLNEESMRHLLQRVRELAASFKDCTILMDFYLRLNWRQHGRVALAMLPPHLLWKILRAPMQLFLRDAEHLRLVLDNEGFEVLKLYSSRQLAKLAGIESPAVELFYLAEMRLK